MSFTEVPCCGSNQPGNMPGQSQPGSNCNVGNPTPMTNCPPAQPTPPCCAAAKPTPPCCAIQTQGQQDCGNPTRYYSVNVTSCTKGKFPSILVVSTLILHFVYCMNSDECTYEYLCQCRDNETLNTVVF